MWAFRRKLLNFICIVKHYIFYTKISFNFYWNLIINPYFHPPFQYFMKVFSCFTLLFTFKKIKGIIFKNTFSPFHQKRNFILFKQKQINKLQAFNYFLKLKSQKKRLKATLIKIGEFWKIFHKRKQINERNAEILFKNVWSIIKCFIINEKE